MKTFFAMTLFTVAEIGVAGFILLTAGELPENIASHFNGAGMPNGFMSQEGYKQFMLVFAVGIPALVVVFVSLVLRAASNSINIPNRDYWLSPENKPDTLAFLQSHIAWLGILLVAFMGFMHWLLLKANNTQPPRLPNELLFMGLGGFLVCMLVWAGWLMVRFGRRPDMK